MTCLDFSHKQTVSEPGKNETGSFGLFFTSDKRVSDFLQEFIVCDTTVLERVVVVKVSLIETLKCWQIDTFRFV